MSESTDLPSSNDELHLFVGELLGCGGVLSQIVTQMVRFDAAAGPDPDAVPIPTAAHELLSEVLGGLRQRYSRRDLKVAAAILKEATDRICEEVFFVDLDELERFRTDPDAHGPGG